jgi:phytoene/squalene synthetase
MLHVSFYQAHLDRVSRSFAFCIRELPLPLRGWVSLSYLMCRMLDTVEDAPWPDARTRAWAYACFDDFLGAIPGDDALRQWRAAFPAALPAGERALLADASRLFGDLAALDDGPRQAILDTVRSMSAGMQHYAEQHAAEGELRLGDIKEVNRYCYFVAGIVGLLLTRLFIHYRPSYTPPAGLLKDAFHFGIFLQKINILKDQSGDEAEGRFLVPSRHDVLMSLVENARAAMRYLTALPAEERGYRTFCAWSLFLGVASLPVIEAAHHSGDTPKLDRADLAALLGRVRGIIDDNAALRTAFDGYLAGLPAVARSNAPRRDWFCVSSGDVLRASELSELHVL